MRWAAETLGWGHHGDFEDYQGCYLVVEWPCLLLFTCSVFPNMFIICIFQLPKQCLAHNKHYTVLSFVPQAPFQNCIYAWFQALRLTGDAREWEKDKYTETERRSRRTAGIDEDLGWRKCSPSQCVLYIVQQRQGYHMQLNNEVGLLHTERVYGKEMDQGDRFS